VLFALKNKFKWISERRIIIGIWVWPILPIMYDHGDTTIRKEANKATVRLFFDLDKSFIIMKIATTINEEKTAELSLMDNGVNPKNQAEVKVA